MKEKSEVSGYAEAMFWGTEGDIDAFEHKKIKPQYKNYLKKIAHGENFGHAALKMVLPKNEEIEKRIEDMKNAGIHVNEITTYKAVSENGKMTTVEVPMYEVYFTWWPEEAFSNPFRAMPKDSNRSLAHDMRDESEDEFDGPAHQMLSMEETHQHVLAQFDEASSMLDNLKDELDNTDLDNIDFVDAQRIADYSLKFLQNSEKFLDVSDEIETLETLIADMEADHTPEEEQELIDRVKKSISQTQKLMETYTEKRDMEISQVEQVLEKARSSLQHSEENGQRLSDISNLIENNQVTDYAALSSLLEEYNKANPERPIAWNDNVPVQKLSEIVGQFLQENQTEQMVLKTQLYSSDQIQTLKEEISRLTDEIKYLNSEIDVLEGKIENADVDEVSELEQSLKEKQQKRDENVAQLDVLNNQKDQILGTYFGKRADHTVGIPFKSETNPHGLDPIAMIDQAIHLHENNKYTFTGVNCARSVRMILEAGGPAKSELPSLLTKRPAIDTPQSAKHFAMYLRAHLENQSPQMKVGSVEYYQIMMQEKLNHCEENAPNRQLIEQCKNVIDTAAQLQQTGSIKKRAAEEISEAAFNLAASPTYNLSAYVAVMEKYERSEDRSLFFMDFLKKAKDKASELISKVFSSDSTKTGPEQKQEKAADTTFSQFKNRFSALKQSDSAATTAKESVALEKDSPNQAASL
ncbi:hypothetical protein [Legionella shakespearei]|uniref:Uncharacterized protein n=1 Tax=Legionella shakespearei DSM 23087 TaxID=1122169 RepID=A0A0W0YLB3_9GAMM|nr:hypothetical protein [Legionella shakespearei]KTD57669.1 hypothetical protein Lsha_2510 [Legionella shakespearei DSM 23087]